MSPEARRGQRDHYGIQEIEDDAAEEVSERLLGARRRPTTFLASLAVTFDAFRRPSSNSSKPRAAPGLDVRLRRAMNPRARALLLLAAAALFLPELRPQQSERYDLLIRNGRVMDGTGNPWRRADVAIRGGRIAAMGRIDRAESARTIEAEGLTVAPGFIDVHSHAGPGLAGELNAAEPLLAQGITTVAVNPDGGGPVDVAAQRAGYEKRGTGVNTALFVPHGSIRRSVLGMADRAPDEKELARMVSLVAAGIDAGGIGLSTGLYYAPGSYAKTEEIVVLARAAARGGGVYSSHIRDEGDYSVGLIAAVDEVIRIAEEAKLPGIVSHMKALGRGSWGLSLHALLRMEAARGRGVEVYADQYPYEASSTGITGALVPRWAEVGGGAELQRRMQGPERARLAADIRANIERRGGAATLVIARFAPEPALEGKSLADLSASTGKPPVEVALDLLARGGASLVSFNMNERDIVEIMRRSYTMTSTDGDLVRMGVGKPHPRGYGAFARKLAVYVRERGVIDLPYAVRSMTSLPAAVFGMKDRGVLRPGAWADVLLFDPDKVRDVATYLDPHHLSAGMHTILVNGEIVLDGGRFTGKLPGRVVVPERR